MCIESNGLRFLMMHRKSPVTLRGGTVTGQIAVRVQGFGLGRGSGSDSDLTWTGRDCRRRLSVPAHSKSNLEISSFGFPRVFVFRRLELLDLKVLSCHSDLLGLTFPDSSRSSVDSRPSAQVVSSTKTYHLLDFTFFALLCRGRLP